MNSGSMRQRAIRFLFRILWCFTVDNVQSGISAFAENYHIHSAGTKSCLSSIVHADLQSLLNFKYFCFIIISISFRFSLFILST